MFSDDQEKLKPSPLYFFNTIVSTLKLMIKSMIQN